MMHSVSRALAASGRGLARLHDRSPAVAHLWRAAVRYDKENGSRLAAAIAYYSFFATFALGVLLFLVLQAVPMRSKTPEATAESYIEENLPLADAHALAEASGEVGVIAVLALMFAGIWWVESLRSSQRALWCVDQHPGNMIIRYLIDLGVLIGLGLLLTLSLVISLGLQDILLRLAGDEARPLTREALNWTSTLLAAAVDLVLAAALLAGVPRLHMSLRRLLPSALLIVVGLALLKTAGRWYMDWMTHNPAYQLAAGAIGLLFFMYVFNQITLFAASLAATSTRGKVRDLGAGWASGHIGHSGHPSS